jgi:beta-phosphoglucomutase-like phosphatase (HAD superfamily)
MRKPGLIISDVDDCLVWSETQAGRDGVIPTMVDFQSKVCRRELPNGMLFSWTTGELVDYQEFNRTRAGFTFRQQLEGVVAKLAVEVSEEEMTVWDVEESLRILDSFSKHLEPVAGAHDMLRDSRQFGVPVVVASSSTLLRIHVSLRTTKMLDLVDQFFSAQGPGWERVNGGCGFRTWAPDNGYHSVEFHRGEKRPKPAGDVYELACEHMGVDPKHAVAIEDSPGGLFAALAAGIGRRIGVTAVPPDQQAKRREQLLAAEATDVVTSLDQVVPLLQA